MRHDNFEKDFNYDEVLKLPSKPTIIDPPDPPESPKVDEVIDTSLDPLAELKEILISNEGMKIDRNLYRSFKKKIEEDVIIKEMVNKQNFSEAENY